MKRLLFSSLLLGSLFAIPASAQWQCSPAGNVPVCRGAGVGFTSTPVRVKLDDQLELYVNPSTGVDPGTEAVGQCTQAAPCATIQHAFEVISLYDLNFFAANINLADGTYPFTTRVTRGPLGSGAINVIGNCTTPDNVDIRPPLGQGLGFGIAIPNVSVQLRCMDIEVADSGQAAIRFHDRVKGSWSNIIFRDAPAGSHVSCGELAYCFIAGDYEIVGDALYHIQVDHNAFFSYLGSAFPTATYTVTLTGTPAFTAFIHLERGAGFTGSQIVFSGSATGQEFILESGSWMTPGFQYNVTPSTVLIYPSNAAGTVNTGAVYAVTGASQAAEVSSFNSCSGTPNLGFVANREIRVTGSCEIIGFGPLTNVSVGLIREITFQDPLILKHAATGGTSSLSIQSGQDMRVTSLSRVMARYQGSDVWYVWRIPDEHEPRPNFIDNPNFDVWQAGTSFTPAASTKTQLADRWFTFHSHTGRTLSRQTALNAQYGLQVQRDAANAATTGIRICQRLEDTTARYLAGKRAILAFDMETGANFSGASIAVTVYYGAGSGDWDCSGVNFATPASTANTGNINTYLTHGVSVARREATSTFLVPANTTQMGIVWLYTPTGTAGAADWFRLSRVKLEINNAASLFVPPAVSVELDKASKRYRKSFLQATAPAQNAGAGTGEFRAPATMTGAVAGTLGSVQFGTPMFLTSAAAVPTCTLYNPAAANAQVRNITDGADLSASAVANVSQMGFEVQATGTAGTAVGETLGVHWTCDSRL